MRTFPEKLQLPLVVFFQMLLFLFLGWQVHQDRSVVIGATVTWCTLIFVVAITYKISRWPVPSLFVLFGFLFVSGTTLILLEGAQFIDSLQRFDSEKRSAIREIALQTYRWGFVLLVSVLPLIATYKAILRHTKSGPRNAHDVQVSTRADDRQRAIQP